MTCVWLCSDFHLTHKNMAKKYRSGYSSVEEHDEYFVGEWNRYIKDRDIVICLGDMATSFKGIQMYASLPGDKKLIMGNHDLDKDCEINHLCMAFDIKGPHRYKEFWLTHFPIHPNELRGKINVHGHIHNAVIDDKRYFNLCPEVLVPLIGRPFIKLDELRKVLKERNNAS